MITKLREPVNGLSHLGGAIAAAVGLIILLKVAWHGESKVISVLIYGISLILLFSASATYHMVKSSPRILEILRKLDHSAIFLLIAGTYTPICINAFDGFFRWGLLSIVWTIALLGILIKLVYVDAPRWVSASGYVLMGWLCISALGQMTTALAPAQLAWLIAGGVVYTLGAIVYATKCFDFVPGIFGYHEVWHIFVLVGAASHYMAILGIVSRIS